MTDPIVNTLAQALAAVEEAKTKLTIRREALIVELVDISQALGKIPYERGEALRNIIARKPRTDHAETVEP